MLDKFNSKFKYGNKDTNITSIETIDVGHTNENQDYYEMNENKMLFTIPKQ